MTTTKNDPRQLVIEKRANTWLIFLDDKSSKSSKRAGGMLLRQTPCGTSEEEARKIAETIKKTLQIAY